MIHYFLLLLDRPYCVATSATFNLPYPNMRCRLGYTRCSVEPYGFGTDNYDRAEPRRYLRLIHSISEHLFRALRFTAVVLPVNGKVKLIN